MFRPFNTVKRFYCKAEKLHSHCTEAVSYTHLKEVIIILTGRFPETLIMFLTYRYPNVRI